MVENRRDRSGSNDGIAAGPHGDLGRVGLTADAKLLENEDVHAVAGAHELGASEEMEEVLHGNDENSTVGTGDSEASEDESTKSSDGSDQTNEIEGEDGEPKQ